VIPKSDAIIAIAAALGGCTKTMQARDLQPSGFLTEERAVFQSAPEDGPLRLYRNKEADWRSYRKIILEPIVIWQSESSSTLSFQEREDLQQLANSFHSMLNTKLSQDYELVNRPAPGTMRIQVAITDADRSWTSAALVARAIPQLQAANRLWTFASGKPAFSGEITVEFKVHDAQTGELLVAGADRRVGGMSLMHPEVFNSWGDVRNSLAFWTDMSAYRLCVLRGDSGCARPKALMTSLANRNQC
jgi:hypothetical protein